MRSGNVSTLSRNDVWFARVGKSTQSSELTQSSGFDKEKHFIPERRDALSHVRETASRNTLEHSLRTIITVR